MEIEAPEIEQLRAENTRLKQLNHIYRNAIAFAGHEWSNQISLLNLSVACLETNEQQTFNDQQKEALARIEQCAAVILRVARNYMHMPHLENGVFRPSRIFVEPVADIFKPLLFSYADLVAIRRQTAELSISRPDLLVWADRELLLTVCQNLLHSVIELGPTDSVISLNVLERGKVDEFCIWNRSTNISEHDLKLVTNPLNWEGAGEYTSTKELGLYIASLIIKAHGGTLISESSTSMGIKFVFTLPKRQTLLTQRNRNPGA